MLSGIGLSGLNRDVVDRDRLAQPLQRQIADFFHRCAVFDRDSHAAADQDLPVLRLTAQPGGKLEWADLVMTGGMMPQRPDTLTVIALAQTRGKPVAVGGPDATSSPEIYELADFRVLGEAEGIIDEFGLVVLRRPYTDLDHTPLSSHGTLVFLLYQKGRDSRIFQAQDRAIDNFTLKGICAGII